MEELITMAKDVNQELFDQRRSQIQSGGVTRRDDGTWVYADKSEVFGREGLDTTTGEVALYSTVPAWHGLGNIIPGGTSDIQQVLELAHLDFDVQTRPLFYTPTDAQFDSNSSIISQLMMGNTQDLRRVSPDVVNIRSDTGDVLGVVGGRYQTIQNRQAFTFLQDLCMEYGVTWESAGALRGGRSVFVSMRLPGSIHIDAAGIDDEIIPFVVAVNSHDGSSSFRVVVTPWRPVCANTERLAVKEAYTSWAVRHTQKVDDRLHEARRTLQMSAEYFAEFKLEEEALVHSAQSVDDFLGMVNKLWTPPDEDAAQAAKTRSENRIEVLIGLRDEPRNYPGTAYGAERALTEYLDHPARLDGKMAEQGTRILEGADDDKKAKAHRLLMAGV